MAKYKLFVDEIRSFRHVVEIETDLNETQLDEKLSEIGDKNKLTNMSDIIYELVEAGLSFKKLEVDENGNLGELKIEEMEEIE